MSPRTPHLRAYRQAAILTVIGLVIQMFTVVWSHPTAFVVFLTLGAVFVVAGVGRYLLALLLLGRPAPAPTEG